MIRATMNTVIDTLSAGEGIRMRRCWKFMLTHVRSGSSGRGVRWAAFLVRGSRRSGRGRGSGSGTSSSSSNNNNKW